MKHKKRSQFLLVALVALAGLIFASNAMASTPPTTTITQKTLTTTINGNLVSAKSMASGKVTVLAREMANGLPKTQQVHCRMIGQGTDVPKYLNSGVSSGIRWWFWDTRLTRVCSVGGHWHKVSCGNLIRFRPPPSHLLTGKVIMVKTFAHVLIKVRAWVHVKASASCGYAEAAASGFAQVRLRILAKARGSAAIRLWAKATARAKATATADITCSSPPPSNKPPTVALINTPAHVFVNGQDQICATASDPDSDNLTVTWKADLGTVSTAFRPDPSGAPQKWCTQYTAPSTTGTETITVTASDGQDQASDHKSFPIVPDGF